MSTVMEFLRLTSQASKLAKGALQVVSAAEGKVGQRLARLELRRLFVLPGHERQRTEPRNPSGSDLKKRKRKRKQNEIGAKRASLACERGTGLRSLNIRLSFDETGILDAIPSRPIPSSKVQVEHELANEWRTSRRRRHVELARIMGEGPATTSIG